MSVNSRDLSLILASVLVEYKMSDEHPIEQIKEVMDARFDHDFSIRELEQARQHLIYNRQAETEFLSKIHPDDPYNGF